MKCKYCGSEVAPRIEKPPPTNVDLALDLIMVIIFFVALGWLIKSIFEDLEGIK